ncbi:MAG: heme ABC exporter ATP-binding protein CcmA [Burkholderiaceae bacterium]|nr:heme ABC exporter ATP-binding protein CcmA [Burkholderiaceae bacterium]
MLSVTHLVGERNGLRLWGPLNFSVRAGEAVHLRGPNGCGKTTLLRTLAGLRPPLAGRVDRGGRLCSFLGHQDGWAEDLRAQLNLELFAQLHGCARAAAPALLKELSIPDRAVRHLSAGQRRKLALARLRIAAHPLLLLDEPFDALDTQGCAWLTALAHTHLHDGGAIVLTSHQALPADFPACRVLDLKGRAILEDLS